MMGPAPLWGEVAYAAVEDQTNGTIVIDGNMLGIGIPRHVEHPITWHVEDGKYQAIEGGAEARRLLDVITGVPGTETVAEFAFGTSDFAPVGDPSREGPQGHRALRPGRQPELLSRRPEQAASCTSTAYATTCRCRSWTPGSTSSRTECGSFEPSVAVITLADVPPVELAGGSWSRVLVADADGRRERLGPGLLGVQAGHVDRRPVARGRGTRLHRQRQRRDPAGDRGRPGGRRAGALRPGPALAHGA